MSQLAAVGVSLAIAVFLVVARRHYLAMPKLTPLKPANKGTAPDCMVIIPARNEADSVAAAVRSFPPDTVIVVDDGSTDGTADVARKAGAGVMEAPELVRGAVGKANACAGGARVLSSKWILFADADTSFKPGFMDAAVAFAETNGLAFVSIYLKPVGDSFGGSLLLPMAVALYFCGVNPRTNVQAAFNGQCLLVRRDGYEFVGGHNAVLSTRVEDLKLAALAERHRLKIATVRAPGLGRVRFRGLWGTVERGGARFLMLSPWIGVVTLLAAVAMALWLPVLAWLWKDQGWIAAGVFALVPMGFAWSWYGSWRVIAAPGAIYFVLVMMLRAVLAGLSGRRMNWRGRQM